MARIKIEDLPVLEELNEKEVKGIFGGTIASEAGLKKPEDDDPNDETKGDDDGDLWPSKWE